MQKNDITFTSHQIVIETEGEEQLSDVALYDNIPETMIESQEIINSDGKIKEIIGHTKTEKKVYDKRFVGICQYEGGKYPYFPIVVNTKSKEIENPRNPDQIEYNDQYFCLIDTRTARVYLSHLRRKHLIASWLSKNLSAEVSIKAIIDEKEFLERMKFLRTISFSLAVDMISTTQGTTLGMALARDAYGLGANWASIKIGYIKRRFDEQVKDMVRELIHNQKNNYKSIMVTARDDRNIESILNLEGITHNIKVETGLDQKHAYPDPDEVFMTLIRKIKENE